MRNLIVATCFALVLTMLHASTVCASQELRERMGALAERVLAAVPDGSSIRVGVFSPTGLDNANSGAGLEAALTDALNALQDGIVRSNAKFEVKGDYGFAKSRQQAGLKVIKVTARIIDTEFGDELDTVPFKVSLDHTQTIAKILQLTGAITDRNADGSQATKEERNAELDRLNKSPRVHVHGSNKTRVSSSTSSPFAVELRVRPLSGSDANLKARQATVNPKGLAFIPIHRDEVYEPRIYNNSKTDVAISMSVDGVDVFHFSTERTKQGKSKYTHFIVPAGKFTAIPGWFQKLAAPNNYLSFLVTGIGQGAITKAGLKSRGDVGVIHIQFSTCTRLLPGQSARSGNETGFGPPKSVKQKAVRYEIEVPHEFLSIRYERS